MIDVIGNQCFIPLSKTDYNIGHDVQSTVFHYAQKTCGKGFFGWKLLFLIKIFNFYQK